MDPKTNTSKFNRYQAEAVIPWVNDVVLYLTIALQTAQQLKDKVIRMILLPILSNNKNHLSNLKHDTNSYHISD